MFSKKEGFKYETEVSKLINEATNNLNQRIISLEIQNQQLLINNQRLEGELVQLKNSIYNDVYILEKRITDFTDIWHPIMTENLNRIKTDLEKTIIETERKDILNIQEELENKLINIVEDKINLNEFNNVVQNINKIEDVIIIGLNSEFLEKIMVKKNKHLQQMLKHSKPQRLELIEYIIRRRNVVPYLDCLKLYKGIIKNIDIEYLLQLTRQGPGFWFLDNDDNDIYLGERQINTGISIGNFRCDKEGLKKLLKVLDECDIQLVYNDSEMINGYNIRDLILL